MDKKHGEGKQAGSHQVLGPQLRAVTGELSAVRQPLSPGEHRRGARPHLGLHSPQANFQTGSSSEDEGTDTSECPDVAMGRVVI